MRRHRTRPLRFYFSFRSPYSWLAYRELVEEHEGLAGRLDWRPFWEPDAWTQRLLTAAGGSFPYTPMSKAKHLYILADVRRLAAARGLTPSWPIDRDPCWEVPHLAYLVAVDEGCGRAFIDLVYRARWEEGRDICDRATIADVADALGVSRDLLADAADDPAVRESGVAALLDVDRDGVFGVPFLVHGHDRYWGVDRLGDFVEAVGAAATTKAGTRTRAVASAPGDERMPKPLLPPHGATADDGHAGGCG